MLESIVYVSSATRPFSPAELAALLDHSRRKNMQRGITGLLLHVGGNFMQALEGEGDVLDELYRRIADDRRHKLVRTIVRFPITERQFPDWAMGFKEAIDLPPEMRAQISSFLEDVDKELDASAGPERGRLAAYLLETFARTMR